MTAAQVFQTVIQGLCHVGTTVILFEWSVEQYPEFRDVMLQQGLSVEAVLILAFATFVGALFIVNFIVYFVFRKAAI